MPLEAENANSIGKILAFILVPTFCVLLGWGANILTDKGVIDTRADYAQKEIDDLRVQQTSLRESMESILASQARQEVILQDLSAREDMILRKLGISGSPDR